MPMRAVSVLASSSTLLAGQNDNRRTLSVVNFGTETCYISSDRSVQAGTGFPIYAGQTIDFVLRDGDDTKSPLWAIAATVPNDFRIYEGYSEDADVGG